MDRKIVLPEKEIPTHWYNVLADLPFPLDPPIHPGTGQPIGPQDLAPLFPMALIEQEVSTQREIPIPAEVREAYTLYRPSPMYRALGLEQALRTPAHIYYKYEGGSPPGSHKPNTAIAQAYYNKQAGTRRITTETGAGQWGSALAFACSRFGIACKVYMVRVSYEQKPYRKSLMQVWGAQVVPSPSPDTHAGRAVLEKEPDNPGSLGLAISEAVEDAATHDDTKYSLGSVLNHVLLHQTVVGQEAQKQMAIAGEYPDVVIGCIGGGSNFAGIVMPFIRDKINGKQVRAVAVEPTAAPSVTKGRYTYDFGDLAETTPLLKMHTLGHTFIPPKIHAGGLRYHGMAPLISALVEHKFIEGVAYPQRTCFDAAVLFARTEGILPAPESAHAIKHAIVEAERAKEEGRQRVILFNLSGHGYFDLAAYDEHFAGRLEDYAYPESQILEAMARIPKLAGVS
ncbi:MAG: TrpB-like pyridoxal phosphate-dependent enzyme [Chloroflexi bacterium]|nr:TrpB-like pyridoxal phosphate-dependent enzyme [Chloroflexota bacterium]